ncbi:MAG: GAF domain-containing protein [Leptospiraceae bacterium]|nr:GAF domain-containing protein [Leptospiraceae bacterium]
MRILILLIFFLLVYDCKPQNEILLPKAKNGILDLRNWDFNEEANGIIPLDGEWEFHWMQLLDSKDFINNPISKPIYARIPGVWNQYNRTSQENTQALENNVFSNLEGKYGLASGIGYATYRLKILLPPNSKDEIFSLRSEEQRTAFKIFVDSKLLKSVGKVGKTELESIPKLMPATVLFISKGNEIELIMQVSNFHHRKGGILNRVYLGRVEEIQSFTNSKRAIDFSVAGILLIISLYHFIYWFVRKKDTLLLIFTLFSALILLRSLFIGEHLLEEFFSNLRYETAQFMKLIIIYWTPALGIHFFNLLFPNSFSRRSNQVSYFIAILFTGFAILAPIRILTFTGIIYVFLIPIFITYVFSIIWYSLLKWERYTIVSLLGVSVFLIFSIKDILIENELKAFVYYSPIGIISIVFSQAISLSMRFSNAFSEKEELLQTLDQKVITRTSELEFERQKAIKRMKEFEKYNEALARLTESKSIASGNLRKALEEITEIAADVLDVGRVCIWKFDRNIGIILSMDLFEKINNKHTEGLLFYEKDYPSYFKHLQENRILVIDDVYTSSMTIDIFKAYFETADIHAILNVSIWYAGNLRGFISFENRITKRNWTAEETNFATSIASLVSNAFESSEKHLAQIKEVWARAEIEILNEITVNLVESPSLDNALMFIFDHMMKMYGLELLVLYFIEDNTNKAIPYKARGKNVPEEIFNFVKSTKWDIAEDKSFLKKVIKRNKISTLSKVKLKKIELDIESSFVSRFGVKSVFAMPIIVRSQIVGIFVSYNFKKRLSFTKNQIESIARFGNQIAGIIQKGKILEETKIQKQEIEKLAESRKRLSMIGEMSSGIVHDIKNPMSTIKGFASMVMDSDLSVEKRNEYLDLIKREIDRLNDMTFEILDFSKGKVQFNFSVCEAEEFLDEVYHFLKIDFEYAGILFYIESSYKGKMSIDKDRIRRVIVNLANNAREAMSESRLDYTFNIRLSKEKDRFVFSLSDNGPGLSESIEGKIFEAFATEGKARGTGLGLFMSKWIIEQHGGNLTYTSDKNKGTDFFISLPEVIQGIN